VSQIVWEPVVLQLHDEEEGAISHEYLLTDSAREPDANGGPKTYLMFNFAAS
jgi:hypothetical protein